MKKSLLTVGLFFSAATLVFVISYSCTKQDETPELKTTSLVKTAVSLPGDNPFQVTVGAPVSGHFFGRNTIDRLFGQPCDFVCGTLAADDEVI